MKKYENSAMDKKADKKAAKKRGTSVAAYEGSAADKKMDKAGQKTMKRGKGKKC